MLTQVEELLAYWESRSGVDSGESDPSIPVRIIARIPATRPQGPRVAVSAVDGIQVKNMTDTL